MISQARLVLPTHLLLIASTLALDGCLERNLKALNPCLVSGVVATVAVTNIDKVDMLFMVDNSDSMADKQVKLRAQFPRLITVMTTGVKADGTMFPPAKDLHLGVVTSDMDLPGIQGIQNCGPGLGDDGLLQSKPSAQVAGCQASYPPFLSFRAGVNQPAQTATDFQCIAVVGTGGCGFEHQLEAPLKALWPKTDPMPVNGMNRIQFLADPATGKGATGHGDVENLGFLRNDPVQGLSLIAVIVLTDEDDCSASDTSEFAPPQYLAPNDPALMEGMNIRCHFDQAHRLYPVERYINGFKALRPGNENLVIFAAITGVPIDLVDAPVLAKTDFSVPAQHDAFYQNILGDPRMQEVVDNAGTPDPSDDRLVHSCIEADASAGAGTTGQHGAADPPIRVVKVAQGFGANGIVQSICQADYGPALDAIIAVIAKQLGAVCLPRSLVRNSSGLVGCNVVWELPPPGMAPPSTPTSCGGANPWLLSPAADQAQASDNGGAICTVAQLAVMADPNNGGMNSVFPTATNGQTFMEGWYYDDYSDDVMKSCTGAGGKQRISFTAMAKPPTGVTVRLECLNQRQSLSNSRTDIMTGIDQPTVGVGCQKVVLNGLTLSGDAACEVKLNKPTQKWPDGADKSMFCHPTLNLCVLSCSTDADCPAAWVCDDRPETLKATQRTGHANGTPICVNPTCGDVK
jgi:hypothetical protein